ncbi:MAG: replication initiator protein [Microviridae sp.]|nr:MAG: replication initiator protein [Microviridae sp.]
MAMRISHEAAMHEHSSFLSLTLRDEDLADGLSVRVLQLFHKRLRKLVGQYRHFSIGEYGEKKDRPHYHAIVFGYAFPDRTFWGLSKKGYRMYRSATLEKAWTLGHSTIQDLTPAAAQYVAHYSVKKLSGEQRARYNGRKPEFAIMSSKPGIGGTWIDKFASSVFPRDFVVKADGKRAKVPRYYLLRQPEAMQAIVKADRQAAAARAVELLHQHIYADNPRESLQRASDYHTEIASRREFARHAIRTTNKQRPLENETPRLRHPR